MRLGRLRGGAALRIGLVAVLVAGTLGAATLVAVRRAGGPPDQRVATIGLAATAGTPTEAVASPPTSTSTTILPAIVVTPAPTAPAPRPTTTSTTARPPTTRAPVPSSTTITTSTSTTTAAPVVSWGPANPANGTWSGESNGIAISFTMTPAFPRAGQTVHFAVTASSPTAYCCITGMYFGDGTLVLPGPTNDPCHTSDPNHFRQEFDHVYDAPGTYVVHVDPAVLVCAPGPPTLIEGGLYAPVIVA